MRIQSVKQRGPNRSWREAARGRYGAAMTQGDYLAGVECRDDAEAPSGWIKWIIPGYEYIYVECEDGGALRIKYITAPDDVQRIFAGPQGF